MRLIVNSARMSPAILGLLLLVAGADAQEQSPAVEPRLHEAIELTRAIVKTERQAIVANAMRFTEQESRVFWPVYRTYHAEVDGLQDRLAELITGYMKDPINLSSGEAEDMLDDYLGIRAERIKLKQKYVDRFQQVLSSIKVVRYYQLENKLDIVVDLELARSIPLIW